MAAIYNYSRIVFEDGRKDQRVGIGEKVEDPQAGIMNMMMKMYEEGD
jgi:hypothetical protein